MLKDEKWSLEHIHAQNSESLTTQEEWKKWLKSHAEILKNILTPNTHVNLALVQTAIEDVLDDIEKNVDTIGQDRFSKISKDVFRIFQVLDGEKDQVHGIDNLALLQCNKNSALNNSVFAVKRNKIVEMDKKGEYIPLGTRNVFLKYYTPSQEIHSNSWNRNDREQYCKAITNELNELFTTEQN